MNIQAKLEKAVRTAFAYPNGRVTASHAGFTNSGEHSHIAIYDEDEHTTHYLCNVPPKRGGLVWPGGDPNYPAHRHNISCPRCQAKVRKSVGMVS